ncbi:MAG: xylosidase, partial [Tannerellaceae bacterium]|nr:xylosidase [Tannerellaceae bacterium]
MKKQFLIICAIALVAATATAQTNKHSKNTLYPSYKGLIMAGYQGWFRAPADGIMYPDETKVRIDMWPDVSEYEITYPTGLKLA